MRRAIIAVFAAVALLIGVSACTTPDGHPLEHNAGQWPSFVVEDHTNNTYFPVNGAYGRWGISGGIRGNCADYPNRICLKWKEGTPSPYSNGAHTGWAYHSGGPYDGQKYWCSTVVNPIARNQSAAIRQELIEHEIGHCFGLAHGEQGSGTMEPESSGQFANPPQDEKDLLRQQYLPS